jgi:thiol-disulfide isomerase/thioredoxin
MPHIVLNSSTDDVVSQIPAIRNSMGQNAVVLVWASWCPHCVTLKPDWNRLKRSIDPSINLIEIESQNLDKIRESNRTLFKKLYPDENRVFYPLIKSFSQNKGKIYEAERSMPVMKKMFEIELIKTTNPKTKLNSTQDKKSNKTNDKSSKDDSTPKKDKLKSKTKGKKNKKGGTIEEQKKKFDKHVEGFIKKWGL